LSRNQRDFVMGKKAYNSEQRQNDLSRKISTGLERISQAYKALLWNKAKIFGLSPIQIQILIFLAHHKRQLCNVSLLAQEFNVTKPTISDAIRVLESKKMIIKDYSSPDNRSYTILLSGLGDEVVKQTEDFDDPVALQVQGLKTKEKEALFRILAKLIFQLNRMGILTVQRTCYGCKFYQKSTENHYCNLLEKPLMDSEIRLDCPEFESKAV